MKAKSILMDEDAQKIFDELHTKKDKDQKMNDEKIMALIEGVIKTVSTQTDTQWDRDARMFTARLMRNVTNAASAEEAAVVGAAAADALQAIRNSRRADSGSMS